jgi:hypothetical protein
MPCMQEGSQSWSGPYPNVIASSQVRCPEDLAHRLARAVPWPTAAEPLHPPLIKQRLLAFLVGQALLSPALSADVCLQQSMMLTPCNPLPSSCSRFLPPTMLSRPLKQAEHIYIAECQPMNANTIHACVGSPCTSVSTRTRAR